MYSWEIDNLIKLRNYLIEVQDFIKITSTSPQISMMCYNSFEDKYYIKTKDKYEWYFKVRR